MDAFFSHKELELQHAHHVETEHHNQEAAEFADEVLIGDQQLPDEARRRAERDEDEGKSRDEQE